MAADAASPVPGPVAETDGSVWELVDAGDRRRLERFGERLVDRPAAGAVEARRLGDRWRAADLRFGRDRGWIGDTSPWKIEVEGIRLELRPTEAGQLGFFPEQATTWQWLRDRIDERAGAAVLNLFAHTGATTLVLAAAGARVTHVDGSRPAVAWARRNADLSGLADRPIRWIVDDALAFVRREARRGRRYDGFVLDPPSFGHGPDGRRWRLLDALPELLEACALIAERRVFVLLTAHTTGLGPEDLVAAVGTAFGPSTKVEAADLELVAATGATLRLGAVARLIRR